MLAKSVSICAEPALSASEIRHQQDRKNTPHFAPLSPRYFSPLAGHQREVRCWHLADIGDFPDVCFAPILLQKSFWGDERKFLEPLMRFTCSDVRGPYRFI